MAGVPVKAGIDVDVAPEAGDTGEAGAVAGGVAVATDVGVASGTVQPTATRSAIVASIVLVCDAKILMGMIHAKALGDRNCVSAAVA
jgi:hypothetical protein